VDEGEGSVIHVQRPVLLNGIDEFVGRSDLGDRSIFLDLPPIARANRLCENEFWQSFSADFPRILGGLLDAVAGGLRLLPDAALAGLPRMADFAVFGEAVGRGLGWPAGTVLNDYDENRRQATAANLEESPVGYVLLEYARYMPDWTGTASDLLYKL